MTETSAPVIVDARGLMPPEPLNLTLEALDTLPPGGEVILILYREPGPLYDILRRNGYTHRTETTPEGEFHIRHTRRQVHAAFFPFAPTFDTQHAAAGHGRRRAGSGRLR